jgi:6-phosphogluconolactonase/glucosamine-6-phosphate isomerase/deaminase
MNLSLILNSSRIILLANGAEKQAVLAKAETDKTLPVHFLIHQTILPIEIESL